MRRDIEELKLSGMGKLEEVKLKSSNSRLNKRDIYKMKIGLDGDYWDWNFTNPYIIILNDEAKGNLNFIENTLNNDLKNGNENFFILDAESRDKNNQPSFSTRFGDWTIEKGDFILPPPEIRFKKCKKAMLKKAKRELLKMSIILPIIVLLVLFTLKTIFETN